MKAKPLERVNTLFLIDAYLVNCVSIGWGNVLSPVRHQAITCTNADLLTIGLLETNFNDVLITKKRKLSLKKMNLKMSAKHLTSRLWWRHQMETFSALLAFLWGIQRSLVNSSHKGQWRGALVFPLICTWTNGWVNNRDTGDLRRHWAHFDVMCQWYFGHIDPWSARATFYWYGLSLS